ncbi:MAG TPA: group III truncated hemoglobin [Pyrinomonadaceae bacterium]|nr:group III truncated hemoglobin [Pyrinomonadaceae bacterium]
MTAETLSDIKDRADIDLLMWHFYSRALADPVIGYIFTDVAKLDLEHHLPIIRDFWETLLFRTGNYARHGRTPLFVHGELHQKSPLRAEHFSRWLEIFGEAVDTNFAGENAEFIKWRARAIANRMLQYVGDLETNEVSSR